MQDVGFKECSCRVLDFMGLDVSMPERFIWQRGNRKKWEERGEENKGWKPRSGGGRLEESCAATSQISVSNSGCAVWYGKARLSTFALGHTSAHPARTLSAMSLPAMMDKAFSIGFMGLSGVTLSSLSNQRE